LVLIQKARPIWIALMESARDLEREGIDLITPLDQVEQTLDRKSLLERALEYLEHPLTDNQSTEGR
jgi:hypothetical protein